MRRSLCRATRRQWLEEERRMYVSVRRRESCTKPNALIKCFNDLRTTLPLSWCLPLIATSSSIRPPNDGGRKGLDARICLECNEPNTAECYNRNEISAVKLLAVWTAVRRCFDEHYREHPLILFPFPPSLNACSCVCYFRWMLWWINCNFRNFK